MAELNFFFFAAFVSLAFVSRPVGNIVWKSFVSKVQGSKQSMQRVKGISILFFWGGLAGM